MLLATRVEVQKSGVVGSLGVGVLPSSALVGYFHRQASLGTSTVGW